MTEMTALCTIACPHGERTCAPVDQQGLMLQGSPVAMFVLDGQGMVRYWNKACEYITGVAASEVINTREQWRGFYAQPRAVLADLVLKGNLDQALQTYKTNAIRKSAIVPGAYEAEGFFPQLGESGKWLYFTAAQLVDKDNHVVGAIETLQDVTARKLAERALQEEHGRLEEMVAERTAELTAKYKELAELSDERSRLEATVSFASTTAMTAMTSMGEMGQLLQTIQTMYGCQTTAEIAAAVCAGLNEYGLEGTVQIRVSGCHIEHSTDPEVPRHDVSVLQQLASMGRIVHFHSRMAINYEHVSVLLRNVPEDDADKAGRIRDNIAILVEAANVRTNTLVAVEESSLHRSTLSMASGQLSELLQVAAEKQTTALDRSTEALNEMLAKIERLFLSLGLSHSQEEELTELIKQCVGEILEAQSGQYAVLEQLNSLSGGLQK